MGNANLFASIARYAIIGFAVFIALEQLQIAPALLNNLFTAIVGSAAIAFGLAFGLGGQDTARKWLSRGESAAIAARRCRRNSRARKPTAVQRSTGTTRSHAPALLAHFLNTGEAMRSP